MKHGYCGRCHRFTRAEANAARALGGLEDARRHANGPAIDAGVISIPEGLNSPPTDGDDNGSMAHLLDAMAEGTQEAPVPEVRFYEADGRHG
ncbi:hypothetical protein [Streptomyces sp. NPDC057302]|uniref:hypothetical protein n=1 Tax=Streptomyces sp. NPDC057302 TaxID=3346094 RepID=UPI00362A73F8